MSCGAATKMWKAPIGRGTRVVPGRPPTIQRSYYYFCRTANRKIELLRSSCGGIHHLHHRSTESFRSVVTAVTEPARTLQKSLAPTSSSTSSSTTSSTTSSGNHPTDDGDDVDPRPRRKVLLDLINHIAKKKKHFWTVEELNMQTQRLLEYCHEDDDDQSDVTPVVEKTMNPSSITFFQVLEAWMERSMIMADLKPGRGTIDCAERARLVLDAMLPKKWDMVHSVVPTAKLGFLQYLLKRSHYEVVLQAYAVSNAGLPAALRAESLLSQMTQQCKIQMTATSRTRKTRHRPPVPTLKTFNIVLNCWAKSNAYEAADRVRAILTFMEEWHDTCHAYAQRNHLLHQYDDGCLPNERSLLCLIEAWTNGRPNEAPEATLGILREVMIATDHRSYDPTDRRYQNVQLDVAVFNAVIYAWVRSNRGRSAAIQAEDILQMMIQWSEISSNGSANNNRSPPAVQPNTRTYSMIIRAWEECETVESRGDGALRAETILMKMVQLYAEGQASFKPNSLLFTSCIAAWSRAAMNCNDAPDRAERLWELLRKLYAETGYHDVELEPTTQIGNAVISAWSRATGRSDSVERALGALDILKQEGKDDLISYNTVLDAMSKKGCAQDALALLHWLEGPDSHRSLVPDLVSYNSVLAAFGRSSIAASTQEYKDCCSSKCCNASSAESLLRKMNKLNGLKPDKLSYTSVINAWSRSDNPQKAFRASTLVRDMIRQYENGDVTLKPDVYVYTTFIKTCAYSHGGTKQENLQILQMALNAMATLENTDYGPPNDVAYATIMTAIYRLSSNDHDSHYEAMFRRCTARGLLTQDVMQIFQRGASIRLFHRLTNHTGRLQPEWSRNVPDHKKPYQ